MERSLRRYHRDLLMVLFLFSMIFSPVGKKVVHSAESESGRLQVVVEKQTISVDLKDAVLGEVLNEIERQSTVMFIVGDSLLQKRLSIEFKALPLREGLKRIVASMNYSLVFDQDGRLAEVVIIGEEKISQMTQRGAIPPEPVASSKVSNRFESYIGRTEVDRSGSPTSSSVGLRAKEIEDFKVIENAQPPGGPVEMSEEELQQFKVIRNVPPPGEHTPKYHHQLELLKPSPGNSSTD